MAAESKVIALNSPVKLNGIEKSEMVMREPIVGDMVASSKIKDPADQELNLFATLCGCSATDIKQMSMRDYKKLQTAYTSFLE